MICRIRHQIKTLKKSFFQINNGEFNNLLCTDRLSELAEISGNYRDKIYTPIVTLNLFLWQVLSDNGSCKEAIAHLISDRLQQNLPPNSFNNGPYCKARQRLSLDWILQEVCAIGSNLHAKANKIWAWKGFNVVLVDGTTVLMPDTESNQLQYPQQHAQKPGLGFPIARIVGLISLSAGTIIDYAIGEFQGKGTGEASLFYTLMRSLNTGDLLLADRYYSTYAILVCLKLKGVEFVSMNHAKKKADFRKGIKLGKKDHLMEWIKPKRKPIWMSKDDYELLPNTLTIREFSVSGVVYISTLLDADTYSKKDLVNLYKERWKVELDFRTLKTDLKMDMLRCKSPSMVEKEIAVRFMAYNLIRGSMAESANKQGEIARHISFKATVQLLSVAQIKLSNVTKSIMKKAYDALLETVATTRIGKRKRPSQPRAIKRRPKAYPLLTEPRADACQRINEAFCES
ncbi:MAG TPA: IS4 family transposase [Gammaproteobacteria bacterium]|nr:IS4 family transposase [Gammaproteobacteria bacterium]